MPETSDMKMRILLALKEEYGDLNRALVIEYVKARGATSYRQIAQDIGLSRSVVERSLLGWSDSSQ